MLPLWVTLPQIPLLEARTRPVSVQAIGALRVDPVESRLVRGEPLVTDDWQAVTANAEGWIAARNGYVLVTYRSPREQSSLLEAQGASFVYVNGEPRIGDVYSAGYVSLPVKLQAGDNQFLFRVQRGRVKASLITPARPVSLDLRDATLPDRVAGRTAEMWGAVVVRNTTDAPLQGLSLEVAGKDARTAVTSLGPIPAMSVRKVGFRIGSGKGANLVLKLRKGREELDQAKTELRVRTPQQTRKVTFVSGIDGSVQYYGLNPAIGANPSSLILSLHGASVEAIGQADAYGPKSWANLVAATNRRPYGYDWEDWGRQDALEVLELAKKAYPHDPARVYLTGHSMGGHGTWHLGVLYPDLFGSIAPSAGWISSFTYAGSRRSEGDSSLADILNRAGNVGDTAAMATNLKPKGVYILHGDADDNVPVAQARQMAEILKPFHRNYVLQEIPGQNHWWDLAEEPGADAVDYGPMMEFLARQALPSSAQVREVSFTTFNPGVSARCHWATIVQQQRSLAASRIELKLDPGLGRISGTTTNVARLSLDRSPLTGGTTNVVLDGQSIVPGKTGTTIELVREGDRWKVAGPVAVTEKNPIRSGPFRSAFGQRMLFVIGTTGTPEEQTWARNKARYDAESWWYRGNGSVDILTDHEFLAQNKALANRSVIVYGNADTNAAWPLLLGKSPVQVKRSGVTVGTREFPRNDLACIFVRPRMGDDRAYVGVVSGTGLTGLRATHNLPYLQPMLGVPDVMLIGAEMWDKGLDGVVAAGFFGNDWSVERGDFAFRP